MVLRYVFHYWQRFKAHQCLGPGLYIEGKGESGSFVIDINFVRGRAKESQSFKIFDLQKLASLHIECFLLESRSCAKHSFDIIKKIN